MLLASGSSECGAATTVNVWQKYMPNFDEASHASMSPRATTVQLSLQAAQDHPSTDLSQASEVISSTQDETHVPAAVADAGTRSSVAEMGEIFQLFGQRKCIIHSLAHSNLIGCLGGHMGMVLAVGVAFLSGFWVANGAVQDTVS